MRRKKKTTIVTFESRERMTIRRQVPQLIAWCEQCSGEVWMVTPTQAAAQLGVDTRTIFRSLELGEIHFMEREGALLVCGNSVERWAEDR